MQCKVTTMHESLNLSPTPTDEDCAQVGSPDYIKQSRVELAAFREQLYRLLKKQFPTVLVTIVRVSHPHDFGTYHDLEVKYDPHDQESVGQAFWLDENLPENWDQEALDDLKQAGYKLG